MKRAMVIVSLVLGIAGCGGGSTPGGGGGGSGGTGGNGVGGTGACTVQKGFCGTLTVPASYNATAENIIVGLYKTLGPAGPMGPPDAIAMQAKMPTISPTQPFVIMPDSLMVSGDYYVYVALYVQGGGMFQPVKGVDYVGQTPQTVSLGGATSPDIGTIALMLAQ